MARFATIACACSSSEESSPDGGSAKNAEGGASASADGGSGETTDGSANSADTSSVDTGADTGGTGVDASKDGSTADTGTRSTSANPFNCKFAWGEPVPSGSLSSDTWLQFMTSWAGYEIQANGNISTFNNGGFISSIAGPSMIPVYYTYFIGYYGHANNLPDQNCCGTSCATCSATQPNLTTGASYLVLSDPTGANAPCNSTTTFCTNNLIVKAYAYYAQQTHAAWPTKPFVWLIEGDFIQYTDTTQVASLTSTTGSAAGLTYAQLGQLAALIATAIKSNMPNAIVAFDDSAWIGDTERPLVECDGEPAAENQQARDPGFPFDAPAELMPRLVIVAQALHGHGQGGFRRHRGLEARFSEGQRLSALGQPLR